MCYRHIPPSLRYKNLEAYHENHVQKFLMFWREGDTMDRSLFFRDSQVRIRSRTNLSRLERRAEALLWEVKIHQSEPCMQPHRDHRWERRRTICQVIPDRSWHIRQLRGFVCHLLGWRGKSGDPCWIWQKSNLARSERGSSAFVPSRRISRGINRTFFMLSKKHLQL